jgi:replicative DNA helicase
MKDNHRFKMKMDNTQLWSEELEKTALGICILDPKAVPMLHQDMFYKDKNKVIFEAMQNMLNEEGHIDPAVLTDKVSKHSHVDAVYVAELMEGIPRGHTEKAIGHISGRLKRLFRLRKLDDFSLRVHEALRDDDLEKANELIERMRMTGTIEDDKEVETAKDLITGYKDYQGQGGGVRIGLPSFDGASNGMAPGEVMYLLARAKVIKSVFTQNMLSYFTDKYPDDGAVFFSLEMNAPQLGERLLMIETGKKAYDVTDSEVAAVEKKHKNVFYITKPNQSLHDIYMQIVKLKSQVPVKLVAIDFLTRITTTNPDEYGFLRHATKYLKDMAKELGISLVVLAQVGRESGGYGATPLSLRAGRGSGTIEEDADFILGAYRPELNPYLGTTKKLEMANVVIMQILGARRVPPQDDIVVRFDKRNLRIREDPNFIVPAWVKKNSS